MTNLNEKQLITEIVGLARSQGLTVHSENAQLNETGMDFQVVFAKDDTGMPWVLRNRGEVMLWKEHLQKA